ncbi:metallophosphoesterase family protein [Flavobacterium album]|uniref:metallophosphoesterase family protein n=1 Tax=Flavobacterium album TaxID=2175091 RepID=UPI0015E7F6C9|nr:metallophosphoesterase family protein [Flavobacterium album]
MSTYIISDIHGCNKTFRQALKKVSLKKTDKLILLGDLIDRGHDSKGVIDTVILLQNHGFDVTCIKGNHEQMLLDALDDTFAKVNWIRNGGNKTLQSFLTSDINGIPKAYIDFIKSFDDYFVAENYIFVHAGINMTIENPYSDKESLLWLRDWKVLYNADWLAGRKVIHGHTPMTAFEIIEQFKSEDLQVYGIDGGAYIVNDEGYGELCVLELETKKMVFQKNIE